MVRYCDQMYFFNDWLIFPDEKIINEKSNYLNSKDWGEHNNVEFRFRLIIK